MKTVEAVLVPSGLLGLLPLHAAWTEDPTWLTSRRYALDEVALSYAPSARALAHGRRFAQTAAAGRLLAVDEPLPVTRGGPLPNSAAEVGAITALFERPQVLPHKQATRAAVLEALASAEVVHFSCHGATDWAKPLRSGLLLAQDEMLTVADLFRLHLEGARLATLSACETGAIGLRLPDEVVGLPAALLQAGFGGVVASLWSVSDASTAMLMVRFYRLWRDEGLAPVFALQEAQHWLRTATTRDLADHYERRYQESGRMDPVALWAMRHFRQADPEARPFAHPFYWAAFTFTGVT